MNGWKATAIIFIFLFAVETTFIGYTIHLYNVELEMTNECYYDVCKDYPSALLENGVCFCYDYNMLGELDIVETEIMK